MAAGGPGAVGPDGVRSGDRTPALPVQEPSIARLEQAAERDEVLAAGVGPVLWRRCGEGPPLVLLHGGHGSWLHWARNITPLSREFELWLPDLPGYGDSALPVEPTLESLVAATRTSLDAMIGANTPIALAGFSFGGLVAAHLAVQRPHLTRMALLGPAGHGGARRPRGRLCSVARSVRTSGSECAARSHASQPPDAHASRR